MFSMRFDQEQPDLVINLETVLHSYLPSISKADEWKKLNRSTEDTDRIKFHLIYQLEYTTDFFRSLHRSLLDSIQLQKVPLRLRHDTPEILHPNSLIRFAQDTELVQQADEALIDWMTQIRNVHVQNDLSLKE